MMIGQRATQQTRQRAWQARRESRSAQHAAFLSSMHPHSVPSRRRASVPANAQKCRGGGQARNFEFSNLAPHAMRHLRRAKAASSPRSSPRPSNDIAIRNTVSSTRATGSVPGGASMARRLIPTLWAFEKSRVGKLQPSHHRQTGHCHKDSEAEWESGRRNPSGSFVLSQLSSPRTLVVTQATVTGPGR
jgi:hypothetical protein